MAVKTLSERAKEFYEFYGTECVVQDKEYSKDTFTGKVILEGTRITAFFDELDDFGIGVNVYVDLKATKHGWWCIARFDFAVVGWPWTGSSEYQPLNDLPLPYSASLKEVKTRFNSFMEEMVSDALGLRYYRERIMERVMYR